MSTKKPTIVIVHGAWQLAAGYEAFAEKLKALGYPTEVVPLPSVGGTETPLQGLPEDTVAVRKALTRLVHDGLEVLLLCHSYGGVVGSCAVEGFDFGSRKKEGKSGGVIMTVYMSAFVIRKGETLLDMFGNPLPWMHIKGDKCSAVASMMPQIAFNDLPTEQAALYGSQMSHSAAVVFATPSTYEPWANGVPCAYIFCTDDNAVPFQIQQQMASQLGPEPTTFTLKAGHCPFLSIPDKLAEVIGKTAEVGLNKRLLTTH